LFLERIKSDLPRILLWGICMTRLGVSQRIRCRDAEWVIKKVETDPKSDTQLLHCLGLDSLVKNARILVIASHNLDIINNRCNKIINLQHGSYR
jgi:hypothetical protein